MKIIENLTADQLNMETVHKYRNQHRTLKPGHPWNEASDDKYLEMIGVSCYSILISSKYCET